MKKTAKILFAITITALILSFGVAEAAGLLPDCGTADKPCKICHLFLLIDNIVRWIFLVLIPAAATLVISIAGFKMLMNRDNSEVLVESKKIILSVIIGIVLAYGSYALVTSAFKAMGYYDKSPLNFDSVNCD